MTPRAIKTRQRPDQEGRFRTMPLVGLCCGMLLWAGVASAGSCLLFDYDQLTGMSRGHLSACSVTTPLH